jgi:hypothetical protein
MFLRDCAQSRNSHFRHAIPLPITVSQRHGRIRCCSPLTFYLCLASPVFLRRVGFLWMPVAKQRSATALRCQIAVLRDRFGSWRKSPSNSLTVSWMVGLFTPAISPRVLSCFGHTDLPIEQPISRSCRPSKGQHGFPLNPLSDRLCHFPNYPRCRRRR